MDRATLRAILETSLTQFTAALQRIPEDRLNRRPPDGGWTPGEVAEHVAIVEELAVAAITGPGTPTTDRAPDRKQTVIEQALRSRKRRYPAPDAAHPASGPKDRNRLIERFTAARHKLMAAVDTGALAETCTAFPHPVLGTLTRWEWAHFAVLHSSRHEQQMAQAAELAETGDTE